MSIAVADLSILDVVNDQLVHAVYQPIVDLDSGRLVGMEALARGPSGSALESPAALFSAARAAGSERELDWMCRAAAIRGALEAGLPREVRLFINAEPSAFTIARPAAFDDIVHDGARQLSIVVEVTERELTANPAALIGALNHIRSLGFGIAIDDVGADPSSLAFLPFIEPDVIKLDMSMVHRPMDATVAAVAAAVSADAERRGSIVLAEGIESAEHHRRAIVLGASLGQGWLFGRPGPLRAERSWHQPSPAAGNQRPIKHIAETPWSLVTDSPRRRRTTKALLMPMSHHLEQAAIHNDHGAVVLASFQHARYFTPNTVDRYTRLSSRCNFVAALGAEMTEQPAPGVRGASLPDWHPLCGEWSVVVIGPHYAGALIARENDGPATDMDRSFDYVVTHDRGLVIAAARTLMQYITTPVGARPLSA